MLIAQPLEVQRGNTKISFRLNASNILQISAINHQTDEHYSFAINKAYLQQNSRFTNIFKEPSKIIDYLRKNTKSLQSLVFSDGELTFAYPEQEHQISILLPKNPQIINILRSQIEGLKRNNQSQDKKIKELYYSFSIISQRLSANQNILTKVKDSTVKTQLGVQSLNKKNAEFDSKITEFINIHNSLKNADQLLQNRLNSQINKLTLDQQQIKNLTLEYQDISKCVQALSEKNDLLNTILTSLKGADNTISLQLKKLEQKENKDQLFIKRIEKQIQKLKIQFNSSKISLDEAIINLIAKDNKNFQNIQQEINRLNLQNTSFIQEKTKEFLELNIGLKAKIEELQDKLYKVDTLFQLQLKQLKSLQEQNTTNDQKLSQNIENVKKDYTRKIILAEQQIKSFDLKYTNKYDQHLKSDYKKLNQIISDIKSSIQNNHKFVKQLQNQFLGPHPHQQVSTKILSSKLQVVFQQNSSYAKSFINKYKISHGIMTYRVKIIETKDTQSEILFSFSDQRCFKSIACLQGILMRTTNQEGRYGYYGTFKKDDVIQCTVNFYTKKSVFLVNGKQKQSKTIHLNDLKGQNLYFEVATFSEVKIDIYT